MGSNCHVTLIMYSALSPPSSKIRVSRIASQRCLKSPSSYGWFTGTPNTWFKAWRPGPTKGQLDNRDGQCVFALRVIIFCLCHVFWCSIWLCFLGFVRSYSGKFRQQLLKSNVIFWKGSVWNRKMKQFQRSNPILNRNSLKSLSSSLPSLWLLLLLLSLWLWLWREFIFCGKPEESRK